MKIYIITVEKIDLIVGNLKSYLLSLTVGKSLASKTFFKTILAWSIIGLWLLVFLLLIEVTFRLCIRATWIRKFPFCVKLCPQCTQVYGRSPVWRLRCNCRDDFWEKAFWHKSHTNGFSPLCVSLWRSSWQGLAKLLPHVSHVRRVVLLKSWKNIIIILMTGYIHTYKMFFYPLGWV